MNDIQDGCVYGHTAGTYVHGLFEEDDFREGFLSALCQEKGVEYGKPSAMGRSRHKLHAVDSVCEISRKGKTQDRKQIRCRLGLGTETDHKWV